MNNVRCWALVAVSLALAVGTQQAGAQEPLGDRMGETIIDQNGAVVNTPLDSATYPPWDMSGVDLAPVTFVVPELTVDFYEPDGNISDRFHFDEFTVTVLSDPETGPLFRRPDAAEILPFLDRFEILDILEIKAFSDGDHPLPTNEPSDIVEVRAGNGLFSLLAIIPEPTSEDIPEPVISFAVPAFKYDLLEGILEGNEGTVSDWVDVSSIHGYFISSGNLQDYDPLEDVEGTLIEDPINGGTLYYRLTFESDPFIPEPSSFVLAGLGIIAFGAVGWRRRKRRLPVA